MSWKAVLVRTGLSFFTTYCYTRREQYIGSTRSLCEHKGSTNSYAPLNVTNRIIAYGLPSPKTAKNNHFHKGRSTEAADE